MLQERNRLNFLDSIRGLACLLVLAQHVFERIYPGFARFSLDYLSIGIVGVVAFFLVSGFVIPLSLEKTGSTGGFLIKRAFRIYPLYLFILVLTVAWFATNGNNPSLINILLNITLFPEYFHQPLLVAVAWTLSLEIVWYIIFSICYYFGINEKPMRLIMISSLIMALLTAASIATNRILPMGRVGYIHSCFVGLMFYRYYSKSISTKELQYALILSVAVMATAFYVTYGYFKHEMFSATCALLSWFCGYVLFSSLFFFREAKHPPTMLVVGVVSYSIYLTHDLFIAVYEKYFNLTLPGGLLVVALVIIFSHFTFRYIESPGITLGKKLLAMTAK